MGQGRTPLSARKAPTMYLAVEDSGKQFRCGSNLLYELNARENDAANCEVFKMYGLVSYHRKIR
jgi:hypothetical protein